jgi:hypothetical protein
MVKVVVYEEYEVVRMHGQRHRSRPTYSDITKTREEDISTKKVNYNPKGIAKLPDDKPVLYQIQTGSGKPNYIGIAQRGRVQERIEEHLGKIPGATVRIEQFGSVQEARKKESQLIEKHRPKYNKLGK